jgi:hypothetical protein
MTDSSAFASSGIPGYWWSCSAFAKGANAKKTKKRRRNMEEKTGVTTIIFARL